MKFDTGEQTSMLVPARMHHNAEVYDRGSGTPYSGC